MRVMLIVLLSVLLVSCRSSTFNGVQTSDIDTDGALETWTLENSRMTLRENDAVIWTSPETWQVHGFEIADSTRDGKLDINISALRASDFGPSKPFWVKENDTTLRDHFFVMKYEDKKVRAVWQSSNLESYMSEFDLSDLDRDGKNELIVIEDTYGNENTCSNNYLAVWQWQEWGFTNIWRSEKGDFCDLKINGNEIRAGDKTFQPFKNK